LKNKG